MIGQTEEGIYMKSLVERIVRECPSRRPASPDEKLAQEIMAREFEDLGLATEWHAFAFNENLYANLALHFGLSTFGTMVSGVAPSVGFLCHGLAAGSYWAESTRRAYILRRLFRFKPSQNILAIQPATGPVQLRIVLLAHADAAFTGLLFHPTMVGMVSKSAHPRFRRSLAMTTQATAALAGFDALRMAFGPLTWPLRPLEWALTVPSIVTFAVNLQMVLQNEIVPGAADNLSGTVALPVLASRLAAVKPPGVELVYCTTGCEEASLGGADALARAKDGEWDRRNTVFIGLDTLCNGQLRFIEVEGEVVRSPVPTWLKDITLQVAASEERFRGVSGFEVPVGGSDVAAFLAHGWDGLCLTCLDPEVGSARHYHQRTDTAENLDMEELALSVDFAEKLVLAVMERRLAV